MLSWYTHWIVPFNSCSEFCKLILLLISVRLFNFQINHWDERELFASWSLFALSVNYSAGFSPTVHRIPGWRLPFTPWCFSLLILNLSRARKAEACRRRSPFFWGRISWNRGLRLMPLVAKQRLCSCPHLLSPDLLLQAWSRWKGGRVPTARVKEHENVYCLLYSCWMLNKRLLLVSFSSFSKSDDLVEICAAEK